MILHDFPWGHKKAPWDVEMTQEDFNLRIAACTQLNSYPKAISFALLSMYDFRLNREAHKRAGWIGGDIPLVIDKTNVVEPTHKNYGLIRHLNGAQVCFRAKQSESVWVFSSDPEDRKCRWPALAVTKKTPGEDGLTPLNFSEQPVEIDQRALSHFSHFGDWIFVDGFGSGTSLIACLNERRSCVATEPDPVQWRLASTRLDVAIKEAMHFDEIKEKKKKAKKKAERDANRLSQKLESDSLKLQRTLAKQHLSLEQQETEVHLTIGL